MTNLNILIVEDEILVATDIEESLEGLGYSVQNAVASGQAAIDEVEKKLPDIILMDIVLKGEMTGIEAANIIRKKYDVPIVYLTANADIATIEKAKISLPYGYIIKPFTEKDLQTNIEIARFKFESDLKSKMESDQFNRFFKKEGTGDNELILDSKKGLEKINLSKVYYIEEGENHSVIFLADEEIITPKSMDECEKIFPSDKFVRTCESYIVNVDKVFIVKFPEIIIADKMTVIPVDEDKRASLELKLNN
jgi:DNA-binding LytR/AlgR family response regulator